MNILDVVFLSDIVETIPWLLQMGLISIAFCISSVKNANGQNRAPRKILLMFATVFLLLSLGSLVIMAGFPQYYLMLWGIYSGFIMAVFLRLVSVHRNTTKLIIWCSIFASFLLLSSISGTISYLVGEYIARGRAEAIARSSVYVVLVAVAVYLEKFDFDVFQTVPFSGLLLILAGDLFMLISCILENFLWIADPKSNVRALILYLALFGLTLLSVYVIYIICKEQEDNELLRESHQQLQSERERFSMAQQQIEEIRSIRHDLKNQRHYMKILLDEERYDDLKRYFDQSEEKLPKPEPFVRCGNKSVNVILNMEFAKIDPQIKWDQLLVVPPVLPLKDEELCSLLTNLLDNAIEECRKLCAKGVKEPEIRLEIYPETNFLYILCQNTTDRTELTNWRSGLKSTKEDAFSHGYGTQIVARTAEKYGGCVEYSLKDNMFIAKVLLDMMWEDGHAENSVM